MRRVEEILRKVCGFLNEKGITYVPSATWRMLWEST